MCQNDRRESALLFQGCLFHTTLASRILLWYTGAVTRTLQRIGLVAISREIRPPLDQFVAGERVCWGDSVLGALEAREHLVALAEVLPGPVNAALGAQALVIRYGVEALISLGSAGALAPHLSPGDTVVIRRAVVHDAGLFLGQRFQPSGVHVRDRQGRIGVRQGFDADPVLVALAEAAAHDVGGVVHTGSVVTGNQAVFSEVRQSWLRHEFDALVVDMETAAVAQVANGFDLPWVAVRTVSDNAGRDLTLDHTRVQASLDDQRPALLRRASLWAYLISHPRILRRLLKIDRGLDLAARRSAEVVRVMLERTGWES